jgi:Arm DNA-binding domain
MRRKLSPKFIEHLKSLGPKRMDVWDTMLQCFGLRVSPTGRKTWFVIVRLHGRQKRVTIGTYPAVSLAEARTEARKIIRDAQLGVLSDSKGSPALMLGGTVPLFIELYANRRTEAGRSLNGSW